MNRESSSPVHRTAACLAFVTVLATPLGSALSQEQNPAELIAAQIRTQGYTCARAVSARKDAARSAPNNAVWVLDCGETRYRVRLIPDMAAQVERLQ